MAGVDHIRAQTPETTGAHSHHAGHSTPSVASSTDDRGALDHSGLDVPGTPSAAERETELGSDSSAFSSGDDRSEDGRGKKGKDSFGPDSGKDHLKGMLSMIASDDLVKMAISVNLQNVSEIGTDGSRRRERWGKGFIEHIAHDCEISHYRIRITSMDVDKDEKKVLVSFEVDPEKK